MIAYISSPTLVIVPENDKEREQLKNYRSVDRLWECYGIDEDDGSLSVQPLCPVGLQDTEIVDYILQLDERSRPSLDSNDPDFTAKFHARVKRDMETMDHIRELLEREQ